MTWLADLPGTIGAWFAALLAALGLAGAPGPVVLQGYVEGETVLVAPTEGGTLAELHVRRGDRVAAGAPLFALDLTRPRAERDEAAAALRRAQAELADLRKGKRPAEIEEIEAQKRQAEAELELARLTLGRQQNLKPSPAASEERLDQARTDFAHKQARVAELSAALEVAALPARADAIEAAEADVAMAQETLVAAERRLNEQAPCAPADARVEDVLFRVGEQVPAAQPVVSLLPPENVFLRFFVPEPLLASLTVGERVRFGCDGCAERTAVVDFVASEAEYTPPVIYSVERRDKLVYRVEARPEGDRAALHPGQPVDVVLDRP
jgi:HlyD family secretion protein